MMKNDAKTVENGEKPCENTSKPLKTRQAIDLGAEAVYLYQFDPCGNDARGPAT